MKKCLTVIGALAVSVAAMPTARAQYTADYQTNTISGVVSNWTGDYLVGSNTLADVLVIQNSGRAHQQQRLHWLRGQQQQ